MPVLHGLAPTHLSDESQLVSDANRQFWSSVIFESVVSWTKTRVGDRSFAHAGPWVCNMLPGTLSLLEN